MWRAPMEGAPKPGPFSFPFSFVLALGIFGRAFYFCLRSPIRFQKETKHGGFVSRQNLQPKAGSGQIDSDQGGNLSDVDGGMVSRSSCTNGLHSPSFLSPPLTPMPNKTSSASSPMLNKNSSASFRALHMHNSPASRGTPVLLGQNGEIIEIPRFATPNAISPGVGGGIPPVTPLKAWRGFFDVMDPNNDGQLSSAELTSCIKAAATPDPDLYKQLRDELGIPDSIEEKDLTSTDLLSKVFKALDPNSDKAVSFDEFYQPLIKAPAGKRLVFVPGQKIRLKEGPKVVM
eukprot:FR741123.1.p1 GENE.FR741123.1~~FR741123.1.p1  ORF type:complete len:288 (-),score=33.50 FR741123.1:62-925(-)